MHFSQKLNDSYMYKSYHVEDVEAEGFEVATVKQRFFHLSSVLVKSNWSQPGLLKVM